MVALLDSNNSLEEFSDDVSSALSSNRVLSIGKKRSFVVFSERLLDALLHEAVSSLNEIVNILILAAVRFRIGSFLAPVFGQIVDRDKVVDEAILQKAQLADIGIHSSLGHAETVAVDTLRPQQAIELVEESDIIDMNW